MTFANQLLERFITEAKKCKRDTFEMRIPINMNIGIVFSLQRNFTEERYSFSAQLEKIQQIDEHTCQRVATKTGLLIFFVGEPVWASGKALRLAVLALEEKKELVGCRLQFMLHAHGVKEDKLINYMLTKKFKNN